MNKILLQLVILCFFNNIIISQNIILSSGTDIELYTTKNINSKNLDKGDEINLYVRNNVSIDGRIIISANRHVKGLVMNSEQAKAGGKQGSIEIVVKEISATDGQIIPVFLDLNNQGEDKRKETLDVAIFWLGPLALLQKGGEAKIKLGAPIRVRTVQDIKFNINDMPVNSSDDINHIYKDLIRNQLATCGEKPTIPKKQLRQSKWEYERSQEFSKYKRRLKKWEDCQPYLPLK